MIKKSTIDTLVIILGMLAPIFPNVLSKYLIVVFYFFIFLRIISNNIEKVKTKLFILIFFIPGLFLTLLNAPEHVLRLIPILILLFGYPFSNFNINFKWIRLFSIFILFYLILTQIILAYGSDTLSNFREIYYPNEYKELWSTRIKPMDESIFKSLFTYRASGLFYNPNIMSITVFLFYIFYSLSTDYINKIYFKNKKKNTFILFFLIEIAVFFSLLFSFSRTIIASYIAYLFLNILNISKKNHLKKFSKVNIIYILLITFGIYLFTDPILDGFKEGESQDIKIKLIINYFYEVTFFNLIFGGIYEYMFDQDIGNWLGAVGLFGLFGFIIILIKLSKEILLRPLILVILIISSGAGLLFGLYTSSIFVPLFIVVCRYLSGVYNIKKS